MLDALTNSEKDTIEWHVRKGYLDEATADEFYRDPEKARQWLSQIPDAKDTQSTS